MSGLVRLDRRDGVVTLTLNRPERHNSLVPLLLERMLTALEAIGTDSTVRSAVLQAEGSSFSTGGDLQGFYDHLDELEAYANKIVGLLNRVILALIELPVPVVAAVHGIVTGGSLGLVLASDIVLVAPEASFTPYYSVVGFSPDGGWTAMLPAIIGPKRAADILMRNDTITAEQAVAWGMATRVVPGERIRAEAFRVAQGIAAQKRGSLKQAKHLLKLALGDLAAGLEAERLRFVQQISTHEARHGMAAFLDQMHSSSEG